MSNRKFPTLVRYGAAIPALLLAGGVRFALDPILGCYAPFVTFFGASMLVAWYIGRGPALLTLTLGALVAGYLFVPPRGSIWLDAPAQWVAIALYLTINILVILLIGFLKRTKEAAEINDRHFRRLLQAESIGIALVDADGGIQYANSVLRGWLGYTEEEVKAGQLRWDRITAPEYAQVTPKIIEKIEETGARALPYEPYEKEYLAKDGHRIPALISLVPFEKRADGVRIGAAFITNLSEIKRIESELRFQEQRMRIAAETAGFGSFDFDLETGEEYWSPELKKLFGLPLDAPVELDSDRLPTCFHPADRGCILQSIKAAKDPNGPGDMRAEHRILQPDGTEKWVLNRSKVFFAGEGSNRRPIRHIGALIDINERKRTEQELRRTNRQLRSSENHLKQANRELQQFASLASHDLKAPLRAVHSLSSWIEEELGPQLSGEGRYHLTLLRDRVGRMDALINALLDYSRAGATIGRPERVSTRELVESIARDLDIPEGLEIRIAPNLPEFQTDRLHLNQALTNLIANAVQYHDKPDGWVAVGVSDLGEDYEFSVADNGPGIPPEYHQQIFELFKRGPLMDQESGTGIGLAVVKKVVESIGGRIALESSPGEGSTFRFTWPKAIVSEASAGGRL